MLLALQVNHHPFVSKLCNHQLMMIWMLLQNVGYTETLRSAHSTSDEKI